MPPSLVIHGHFYQPPREDPRTGEIDNELGAHPFPNWNERIHAECYAANAFAPIRDGDGRTVRVVNNFDRMSFNVGPTLAAWIERRHPDTYGRILAADRESRRRIGHGNAIAQAYNHAILPLCNERDRLTQIRWGIADFRHRFGRVPEGMWLPETAANSPLLDTLIEEGIRFTLLVPSQAAAVRPLGKGPFFDVSDGSIDSRVAYRHIPRDGSGRCLDILFTHGGISHAIAFEENFMSSASLAGRFAAAGAGEDQIAHAATDGETFGHHKRFGALCLAYALETEAPAMGFHVTNYAEYLERHPPRSEVRIKEGPAGEGTAWSCAHGVGRWYRDCGCQSGGEPSWNQAWRGPLRRALDVLRDRAAAHFEEDGGKLLRNPWEARDDAIRLILDPGLRTREDFLCRHALGKLSGPGRNRALAHLDIQRLCLLMYTSCGWFSADISGIESTILLRFAGQAIRRLRNLRIPFAERLFLDILSEAKSNLSRMGTGADIYRRIARNG
ncbi:MAG: DUF3536 domain-containing protein [Planctomycetota bacterium]